MKYYLGCNIGREGISACEYLSSIQHRNLTSYRLIANSSPIPLKYRCLNKRSQIRDIYFIMRILAQGTFRIFLNLIRDYWWGEMA
jgi:hypothetical protein